MIGLAAALCLAVETHAQWATGGNVISGLNYLGAATGSTVPLLLKTIPDLAIDFHTSDKARMRLNPRTTVNIGSYLNNQTDGFLGLSPDGSLWNTHRGPFSRLHLDDATGMVAGLWRPWMRNGVYMSGNNDMMYVGQLFRTGYDESDAVVAWGDNELSPAGPDHLRFLFMGVSNYEGREVTRITGGGFFGIGNFDAAGVNPDERLDLLDKTLRLRSFVHPTNYRNDHLSRILVADDQDG